MVTQICKGGSNCGWREDGQYHCHCYSRPTDKISRIKEVINRVREYYKDEYFPICSNQKYYQEFINAVDEIEEIIEKKE